VRKRLAKRLGRTDLRRVAEMRMFGGVGFMLDGNMCCGVHGAELIVRVEPSETDALLKEPGVRLFDLSGRPMKGWLLVAPDALVLDGAFNSWIDRAVRYAGSLPRKKKK
jgi:TfoX/Sxy family transcriptional regulator of competence genes